MKHQYSFTLASGNKKTGPIPVTTTSSDSCPSSCSFKGNGCYAEIGPVAIWWSKLDARSWGIDFDTLLQNIKSLSKGTLWRHNQAGDLPVISDGVINTTALQALTKANKGRRGFTYTHHNVKDNQHNALAVKQANTQGFTVNLSADTLQEVDELASLNIGTVVCVMPDELKKENNHSIKTPAGNTVVQCPATYMDNMDCMRCGICAVSNRKAIIGFPVHGTAKNKARKVIRIKAEG